MVGLFLLALTGPITSFSVASSKSEKSLSLQDILPARSLTIVPTSMQSHALIVNPLAVEYNTCWGKNAMTQKHDEPKDIP